MSFKSFDVTISNSRSLFRSPTAPAAAAETAAAMVRDQCSQPCWRGDAHRFFVSYSDACLCG